MMPFQGCVRIKPFPVVVLSRVGSWNMRTTPSDVAWTSAGQLLGECVILNEDGLPLSIPSQPSLMAARKLANLVIRHCEAYACRRYMLKLTCSRANEQKLLDVPTLLHLLVLVPLAWRCCS
jgi:hypothetical protein